MGEAETSQAETSKTQAKTKGFNKAAPQERGELTNETQVKNQGTNSTAIQKMGEHTGWTLKQGNPITKSAIWCLARQGGTKRLPRLIYEETKAVL